MVANVSLLFQSAIKRVFDFPLIFCSVLHGGEILSSHRTETSSRGAERCTWKGQTGPVTKQKVRPQPHTFQSVSCTLSIAFATLS